ncbi:MAG: ferrochelatase [Saprospiraceae bacterium]
MAKIGKTGVLLVNLGTPDAPTRSAVYRYLKEFLSDPRVIDKWLVRNLIVPGIILPIRSGQSAKLYKELWMEEGSPLKVYGFRLRDHVQEMLGEEYHVELAMRYQSPAIESTLEGMIKAGISELLVLPLFPQYASASTGSVQEEVMRVLTKKWNIPSVKIIDAFYDNPKMIAAFAARGRQYDIASYDHILFSYHGLPERQITKGDDCNYCLKEGCCDVLFDKNKLCYKAHCAATTRGIVKELNLKKEDYTICFQSRLGRDPWVKPYTTDIIKDLAKKGAKRVLVFCPAFICDCLETSIEISVEYQEEFEELGGEKMQLVEGLNDHPLWIEAVKEMVLENVTQKVAIG